MHMLFLVRLWNDVVPVLRTHVLQLVRQCSFHLVLTFEVCSPGVTVTHLHLSEGAEPLCE